jgi:acetyl/propionyl-CoA carboxylase alpha subunit
MTIFQFSGAPSIRHSVTVRGQVAHVDGTLVTLRAHGNAGIVAPVDGRSERLLAMAHGDCVYVQLKGRSWRLDVVDPTRSTHATVGEAAGSSLAPMPGVVVSLATQVGRLVRRGDALLVIESMKLQMTITAQADGTVVELPIAVGQTFRRGAMLARTSSDAVVP